MNSRFTASLVPDNRHSSSAISTTAADLQARLLVHSCYSHLRSAEEYVPDLRKAGCIKFFRLIAELIAYPSVLHVLEDAVYTVRNFSCCAFSINDHPSPKLRPLPTHKLLSTGALEAASRIALVFDFIL